MLGPEVAAQRALVEVPFATTREGAAEGLAVGLALVLAEVGARGGEVGAGGVGAGEE